MAAQVRICGQTDCPNDPEFVHEGWPFGCVPRDFSMRTGRSKRFRQHRVDSKRFPLGYRYMWNGGCDAIEEQLLAAEGPDHE